MPRPLKKISILAFPVIALTSCFGAGAVHGRKQVHTSFQVRTVAGKRVIVDGKGRENPSAEVIRGAWGNPDKVTSTKNDRIWTYNTDLSLSGIVPMVGIGIPLVVPTGSNGIDLFFWKKSDFPYKAEERTTTWSGGYFGPRDEISHQNGFQKLTD